MPIIKEYYFSNPNNYAMKFKRISSLITLCMFLFCNSCTSIVTQSNEGEKGEQIFLTKSSVPSLGGSEDINFCVSESDVRNYINRHADSPTILSIDAVKRDEDTLLYVVNYRNGWALFSADKHLEPVVAENKTGSFCLETLDNPGVLLWMNEMMDLTSRLRQETEKESANEFTDIWEGRCTRKKETDNPAKSQYTWTKVLLSSLQETIDTLSVGPFLQTEWGQNDPWNMRLLYNHYQSHFRTGCAAVAISQLLYYYNDSIGIPSGLYHGITVHSYYDYGTYYTSSLTRTDYTNPSSRWAQMVKKYSDYDSTDSSSVSGASYVADLMTDVGNRVNMRYAPSKSYTMSINDIYSGLSFYGLTGDIASFSDNLAYTEILIHQRPFYMEASPLQGMGHAWVVDGMKQNRIKTTNTYRWYLGYSPGVGPDGEPATQAEALEAALEAGYDHPEELMETQEVVYSGPFRQYYMNWGWDGQENGYYSENPTVTHNGNTYSFVNNRQMVYNIRSNTN